MPEQQQGLRDIWSATNSITQAINALTQQLVAARSQPITVLGLTVPSVVATAAYTMLGSDTSIIAAGAATLTVTLSPPALAAGRLLFVKNTVAFTVVSATANVVPLAGGAAGTAIIAATAGKFAILQSDGTNWQIMAAN